ncbi:F0F1 ATP synthase subunit epsilon [Marinicrinis lubricantis]|uniref:ATP synthase epsilon chain n=1 Tax=Marinicrinis lubricantis TaxID=2086470 RepID=A0ABW1IKB0_9BACL
MSTMVLEIVTPERKVYEKEVEMVLVKGVEGELGIFPNHVPLVTPLSIAPVRAKVGGKEEVLAVGGGFMEVRKDKVVILAESAEFPNEIDVERANAAKVRAEQRLSLSSKASDEVDFKRAELALKKALNRIDVAQRR